MSLSINELTIYPAKANRITVVPRKGPKEESESFRRKHPVAVKTIKMIIFIRIVSVGISNVTAVYSVTFLI